MSRMLIEAGALQPATLRPPPSKSDAQRALVLAHLLGHELSLGAAADAGEAVQPSLPPLPDDVQVVERGLAAIRRSTRTGTRERIDCGDGGAPFRLLLSQAAIAQGARVEFVGSPRLGERPHRALWESLQRTLEPAGLRLAPGTPWPVTVDGAGERAPESTFRVDVRESSQYASSLLLAACGLYLREREGGARPWTVALEGSAAGGSAGYLELTVRWAERCGFVVERATSSSPTLRITGHRPPQRWPDVPGDWSSLGYLLLIAWASGGEAAGLDLHADHPDKAVLRILGECGLSHTFTDDRCRVTGAPSRGVVATAAECPDLIPTLAALACVCPSPSIFSDVHLLRAKESDRLQGVQDLVAAAGGRTTLDADGRLTVFPPERVQAFGFHSRGDHRMAMSASLLAVLGAVPLTLEEPECVSKSFPGFFDELSRVGVRLTRLGG